MPCRTDALLLGVAAALLMRQPLISESLKRQRGHLVSVWIVLFAGFSVFLRFKITEPTKSVWMSTIGLSWMAMFYLILLLLALVYSDGWLGRFLRNTWLKALGTISYGVYLLHMPVLGLTFAIFRRMRPWAQTPGDRLMIPLALVFTLAIASISWTIFEKPLLKIGHSVKY
jgi:peptidoglycan/LPS O-acetylase OafA/YrhL